VTRPWPAGAATGIGSLPETDPVEACRLIFGELPDLPHLPELPQRGIGAELTGRGVALLVDLPAEVVASGWRMAANPGRELRRAQDFLARDLDALESVAAGYLGPVKVQAPGPWTLAATIEVHSGHRMVADPGATRELAQSLTEGLRLHLADLQRRLPKAALVLQLDEPSLPAVLAGELPTASGWGTVRSVPAQLVEETLAEVLKVAAPGHRVVHCCAPGAPITLLSGAGADAVAIDSTFLRTADNDMIGEAIDGGLSIWLGVLPGVDAPITLDTAREPIAKLWNELGFAKDLVAQTIVPTPACGLAGASPAYARRVLGLLREAGRDLLEQ
jgi:methionine synthase II (cobalamin-independent)